MGWVSDDWLLQGVFFKFKVCPMVFHFKFLSHFHMILDDMILGTIQPEQRKDIDNILNTQKSLDILLCHRWAMDIIVTLNEHHGVSNHQQLHFLFKYLFRHILKKKNKKKLYATGPLWGESTGDWWIQLTKAQKCGKCFHIMSSSWSIYCEYSNPLYRNLTVIAGIILGMGSANVRRRYIVTPPLIGWAHTPMLSPYPEWSLNHCVIQCYNGLSHIKCQLLAILSTYMDLLTWYSCLNLEYLQSNLISNLLTFPRSNYIIICWHCNGFSFCYMK